MNKRPRIKIRPTALDYTIEVFAVLSVLAVIILYAIYWTKAPEIVPIHYNIYGEADGWGSKTESLSLPITAVFFYIGLTILNKYPHIFNFPTTVTEQNAFSLYKIATRMMRWLKLLLCLLFAYMIWHELRIIITNQESKLDGSWLFIAVMLFILIFSIVKMIKKPKNYII